MNSFERRNKIVDLVNAQGSVMVLDLSSLFGISEVTIRTDLRLLEEKVDAVETGSSACVLFEQGLSTVDVRKLADKLAQKVLFAAVFNGSDADGYQYVICASDRDVSAFGKAFNKALCGRGGGKNPMIQGQVKAEQKAIWEYLTKEGVLQDGK